MAETGSKPKRGRKPQPQPDDMPSRKAEIIEGGYRVVQKYGHKSLTFRSVAEEAKVPLGSTTYYFSDKTDLLRAILLYGKEQTEARYEVIVQRLRDGAHVLDVIAELVETVTTRDKEAMTRDYELFLSGFEDEALTDVCRQWTLTSERFLQPFLPDRALKTLPILLEGIFLVAATTGRTFSADEVRDLMAPLFAEDCAAAHPTHLQSHP